MSTFSIRASDGIYQNSPASRSITSVQQNNLIVATISSRSGYSATTLTVTDDNFKTWKYVDVESADVIDSDFNNTLLNPDSRISLRIAYRLIESDEQNDTLGITASCSSGGSVSLDVVEIVIPSGYVPSIFAASVTGSGITTLNNVATSTPAITGSDLLHIFAQVLRVNNAITGVNVDEYVITTEYAEWERLSSTNQITSQIGVVLDGQSASNNQITVTSDLSGTTTNINNAEGIIAQAVFKNSAGNITGTIHTNTNSFGAGTVAHDNAINVYGNIHTNTNSFGSGTITGGVSHLISDDFKTGINTGLWSLTTPGNFTAISAGDSDGEYFAQIAVTDGTNVDPYDTLVNQPLLTQIVDNTDFVIKAKWLTQPEHVQYRGHGFIIRNASGDWFRFDINTNGTNYFAYSSTSISSVVTPSRINTTLGPTTFYSHLRVTRSGNTWTFDGSNDNTNWTTFGSSYQETFTVNDISLTTLSSSNSTGYAARVDWIEDSTNPISNEDVLGDIAGTIFNNINSIGSGTITTGSITISGTDHIDPDIIGTGQITAGVANISGTIYADPDIIGTGQITAGVANISGTDHIDPDIIGSGTITTGIANISGAIYADPDIIGSGTVSPGIANITGSIYTDPDIIGSGTVTSGTVNISGTIYSDPDIIGSGIVTPGTVNISGTIHSNTNSFGSGTAANIVAASEIITWPAGGAGSADFETTLDSGWSYTDGFSGTLDTSIFAIVDGQVEYQYGLVNGVDPGTVASTTGQANPFVSTPISGDFDYYALISESPLGYHDGGYLGYGFTVYNGSESSRWEMYMAPAAVAISTYVRIGSGLKTSNYTYPDINRGFPTHMRLQRVSGIFTFSASMDGTNWSTIATVSDRVDFAPTTLGVYGYKFGSSNTVAYSPKLELIHANSIAQPTVAEYVTRTNIWNSAFIDSSEIDNQSLLGGTITFNAGTMTLSTPATDGATSRFAYIDSDLPANIGVLLKVGVPSAGTGMFAGIQLRANSWRGTNWTPHYGPPIGYVSEIHGTTSTQRLISIHATNTNTDGGYWNFMQAASSTAGAPDVNYLWHRFEAIGPVIRMKTWHADSAEPAAWELQVVDRTIQDPGAFGIAWAKNDGNTSAGDLEISDLSLYSITSNIVITGSVHVNTPIISFDDNIDIGFDDSDVTFDQETKSQFGSGVIAVGIPNLNISGSIHNDPDVIGSGVVTNLLSIVSGTIHNDPDTIGNGTITAGTADISGSIHNDPDVTGSGTISAGAVNIIGSLYINSPINVTFDNTAVTFDNDIITFDQVSHIFGSGTITAGSVNISGSIHNDLDVFSSGTISTDATYISGSIYNDPDTIGNGTITAGTADISGSIYNDPDVIGSGTITAGSVNIVGSIYNDPDIFGSGSIGSNLTNIIGSIYINSVNGITFDNTTITFDNDTITFDQEGKQFGSGVITVGEATSNITGTIHNDPDTIGNGSISVGIANISGSIHNDPDTIGNGTITAGIINISGSIHTDPDIFSSGNILTDVKVISGTGFNDPDIIGNGSISVGIANISGSIYNDPDTISSGQITSIVNISGSIYNDPDVISSGSVDIGAANINGNIHINTNTIGSGSFTAGSISIVGSIHNDPDVIGSGEILVDVTRITGSIHNDPDVIGSGQIDTGTASISGTIKPSENTFGSGQVIPDAIVITGTDHINQSVYGAGNVEIVVYEIAGSDHTNDQIFGSGSVNVGAVTINGTVYNEINIFGVGVLYDPLTLVRTGGKRIIHIHALNRTVDVEKQNRTIMINYQDRTTIT